MSKRKVFSNIYQWAKIYNFLLPDFKLPPKVSCVTNSDWSNSGLLLLKVTNITPLFKLWHHQLTSTYENQTRDQQKIPANLSPWYRIPATVSWISHVDFVSKKKQQKRKNNTFLVLKKKKEMDKKKRVLSTCRITDTHTKNPPPQKNQQNIEFWYSA